jgi:cytochrome c553
VPPGSLAKGAALMAGGDGKTVACTICHGETLKGLGEVPGIVGRDPIYTFRQLNDMKTGNRKGPWVELMKQVVVKLSDDDMISVAAFLGSLDP